MCIQATLLLVGRRKRTNSDVQTLTVIVRTLACSSSARSLSPPSVERRKMGSKTGVPHEGLSEADARGES